MRRRMLLVAAAVGVSVAAGAFAALAQAQTDSVDTAGSDAITVAFRPIVFRVDAHSGPSGEDPSGSAFWGDRVDLFGGPVTCLNVTGNRATIGLKTRASCPTW